jgi:prevent-host-death family protein
MEGERLMKQHEITDGPLIVLRHGEPVMALVPIEEYAEKIEEGGGATAYYLPHEGGVILTLDPEYAEEFEK